jgi:hypothetical protein
MRIQSFALITALYYNPSTILQENLYFLPELLNNMNIELNCINYTGAERAFDFTAN